jgi:hypothetical protein
MGIFGEKSNEDTAATVGFREAMANLGIRIFPLVAVASTVTVSC